MPCPPLEFQLLYIELGKQKLENVVGSHQSKLKLKMVWSEGLLNSMHRAAFKWFQKNWYQVGKRDEKKQKIFSFPALGLLLSLGFDVSKSQDINFVI